MIPYTENNPEFSESIQITEVTDPAHADNINMAPKQLLQNTLVNNQSIMKLENPIFEDYENEDSEMPVPDEAVRQIKTNAPVRKLYQYIKASLQGILTLSQRALDIAKGKNQARVFATVGELDAWLDVPDNVKELNVGDNFYIIAVDVPDYWWDGNAKQKLETQKVDLNALEQKIEKNSDLIRSLTNSKVNVTDIINSLTSTATNKPLAASQGKAIAEQISALKLSFQSGCNTIASAVAARGIPTASGSTPTVIAGNIARLGTVYGDWYGAMHFLTGDGVSGWGTLGVQKIYTVAKGNKLQITTQYTQMAAVMNNWNPFENKLHKNQASYNNYHTLSNYGFVQSSIIASVENTHEVQGENNKSAMQCAVVTNGIGMIIGQLGYRAEGSSVWSVTYFLVISY